MKDTIRIYCDKELKDKLQKKAEADNRSLNNYLVLLLKNITGADK